MRYRWPNNGTLLLVYLILLYCCVGFFFARTHCTEVSSTQEQASSIICSLHSLCGHSPYVLSQKDNDVEQCKTTTAIIRAGRTRQSEAQGQMQM